MDNRSKLVLPKTFHKLTRGPSHRGAIASRRVKKIRRQPKRCPLRVGGQNNSPAESERSVAVSCQIQMPYIHNDGPGACAAIAVQQGASCLAAIAMQASDLVVLEHLPAPRVAGTHTQRHLVKLHGHNASHPLASCRRDGRVTQTSAGVQNPETHTVVHERHRSAW